MRPILDLHMHTTYSDGVFSPEELTQQVVDQGLRAMAITDHDNVDAFPIALATIEASGKEVELIPGIEINTFWKDCEVHILGYYINNQDSGLQALIERHRKARVTQIQEIAERLQTLARLNVTFEDIAAFSRPGGSLGRPHIAKAIVEKGGAPNISEAFNRFLNRRTSKTYVKRETVPPHDAVEAIYESGGIAVIAHPGEMPIIEELVPDLMNYGLRGLEAYHKSHSPALNELYCSMAERYGLIVTGGTDFHGLNDGYESSYAHFFMPNHVYDELKKEQERLSLSSVKAS